MKIARLFLNSVRGLFGRVNSKLFLSVPALATGSAYADLPTAEAPSRGEGNGFLQLLQNYTFDGAMLVALVFCAFAFLAVAWHSVASYSEVQAGRKSWGQFGGVVIVGAVLLVLVIWMCTKAADVL